MGTYPTWQAGQRVTAAMLTAAQPLYVVRTGDATGRTNTTLTNDDTLLLPVEANAVYSLRAWLGFNAATAADYRIGWSMPSGASLDWTPYMQPNSNSTTVGTIITDRSASPTTQAGGGGGGSTILTCLAIGVLRTGGSAGTLALQWAQDVANATATVLKAWSDLELRRRS